MPGNQGLIPARRKAFYLWPGSPSCRLGMYSNMAIHNVEQKVGCSIFSVVRESNSEIRGERKDEEGKCGINSDAVARENRAHLECLGGELLCSLSARCKWLKHTALGDCGLPTPDPY